MTHSIVEVLYSSKSKYNVVERRIRPKTLLRDENSENFPPWSRNCTPPTNSPITADLSTTPAIAHDKQTATIHQVWSATKWLWSSRRYADGKPRYALIMPPHHQEARHASKRLSTNRRVDVHAQSQEHSTPSN